MGHGFTSTKKPHTRHVSRTDANEREGISMDAVEFFRQRKRMCKAYKECCECGLYRRNPGASPLCEEYCFEEPEKAVQVVEKWAAEHPVKTRLTEFLRLFPEAPMDSNGYPAVNTCMLGEKNEYRNRYERDKLVLEFWNAEV